MKTLLLVRTDQNNIYDDSMKGLPLKKVGNITKAKMDNSVNIKSGYLKIGSIADFKIDKPFTIEISIKPKSVIGSKQSIFESRLPSITLYLDDKGYIVGGIKMKGSGWQTVKSSTKVVSGSQHHITFSRNSSGLITLEINGKKVSTGNFPGGMDDSGSQDIKIGKSISGRSYQFKGDVGNIIIRDGELTAANMKKRISKCKKLENDIKNKLGSNPNVFVNPNGNPFHRQVLLCTHRNRHCP